MTTESVHRSNPPINAKDFGVPAEFAECAENYAQWAISAEREACAIAGGAAADAGRDVAAVIRARGQPDAKVTHLNEWARDRLARHGIPMPGDDDGNPSF
jgi:hypothetical protein